MVAEILAALAVVTVLVVLLLGAVITERVTRVVAILRHTRNRYDGPRDELSQQLRLITVWRDSRES